MTTSLRNERHGISSLKIHLGCVTKYCRSVFTAESLAVNGTQQKIVAEIARVILESQGYIVDIPDLQSVNPRIRSAIAIAENIFEVLTGDRPDYGE